MALILVVDDEESVRKAITDTLREGGHSTLEVGSALSAMKLLRDQLKNNLAVDLIVCDVMMTNINGYQLCQILQLDPNFKKIPVIFLSAKKEESDRLEGVQTGAIDYLGKPFSVQELYIRINSALLNKGSLDQHFNSQPTVDPMIQLSLEQCLDMIARYELGGKLTVSLKNSELGIVFFGNGQIIHAELNSEIGESVVTKILDSDFLMYSFESCEIADQVTMAMKISTKIKNLV